MPDLITTPTAPAQPVIPSDQIVGHIDDTLGNAVNSLHPIAQEALRQSGVMNPGAPPAPAPVTNGIKPPPMGGLPASAPGEAAPPQISSPLGIPGMARGGQDSVRNVTANSGVAPAPATPQQAELNRLRSTGSGVSQIKSPWARIPLQILDALGRGLAPGIEMGLPGTSGHHDVLLHQAGVAEKQDEDARTNAAENAQREATTENLEAQPDLRAVQSELAQRKEQELETGHRNTEDINRTKNEGVQATAAATRKATLASHGFKEDEKGQIVPLEYGEMSETQQAVHDLKTAQSEQAEAAAALKKAQADNQPAAAELAKQRLTNSQKLHDTAAARLGLSERQFEMRSHGTEGGAPLPGAMLDDNGHPIGTAFQQNVRPTGTQRDAAGRADTMLDLDQRIRKALQDPEIAKGTGPLAGRLAEAEGRLGTLPKDLSELRNDLVSYGAFQAGLHPVRGIGALQYFDKVMGGLGQIPEELIGKLDSNKATAESVKKVGSPKTAGSKAAEGTGGQDKKAQGGYEVGKKYGDLTYQGGDPNRKENWK